MHRWRYPSLSLHGIEGAFSEAGAKTVIPRKVIGKFSIRLVPDMDPKVVEKQVRIKIKAPVCNTDDSDAAQYLIYNTDIPVWFECLLWIKSNKSLGWNIISFPSLSLSGSFFNILKVVDYVQKKFAELESPNKMKVSMGHGARAWVSDFNHPHYMAGRKAMKTGTGTR